MKFYLSQVPKLFELIASNKIKAVLLYGPDKGYIDKICYKLIQDFSLVQMSVEYGNLNAATLEMLLNSQNFFAKRELIKIRSVTNSLDKNLKSVLSGHYLHLPLFIGDEVTTNSAIRKFFETEEFLASIGCYHDDAPRIEKFLMSQLNKVQKNIDKEALTYLVNHLRGDHNIVCNEISKLISFTFDKTRIDLRDVKAVISGETVANGDKLFIYFAKKDYYHFLHELAIIQKQNINEVLIIRALIRYYLNLYIVLSKIKTGEKLESAVKSLSPPIFYQYVDDFTKIAKTTDLDECIKILAKLQQAEVNFKLRPHGFDLFQQICN